SDYKNGAGTDVDWHDETLKKNTPFSSADLSFKGGGDNARYYVLVNHTQSNGFYDVQNDDQHSNAQMAQYNIRSNLDFSVFKYVDGKMDLGGRIENRKYPAYTGSTLWANLERYPNNIYPVRNDNGTWTGTMVYPNNPVASIRELGINTTHDRSMQVNYSLKVRLDFLVEGLYLTEAVSFSNWTRGSRNITKDYARHIGTEIQTSNQNTNYVVSDDYGTNQWDWKQWQLTAGYDKDLGLHKIKTGLSYLQSVRQVDQNQNGEAGVNTRYAYINLSGRAAYSYNGKYLGEISFAHSGSDNYKPGNRFVFYPVVSAGWIVSKEKFMSDLNAVDFLKLRASAGQVGYDYFSEGRYLYQQYYKNEGSYPTGASTGEPTWNGAIVNAYIANPEITAEKSAKYNLGMDVGLLKDLSVTIDGFVDKRSGIVSADNYIMAVVGMDAPYRNVGKVTTKGFEFKATYENKSGALKYNITAMGTYVKDKIDYMAELPTASPYASKTGKSIGTPVGYEAIGFYDISDFDAGGNLIDNPVPSMGAVQPGDIKYRNLNDDNVIDERDKKETGHTSFPDFVYSFAAQLDYKGFDLRILMQGVSGRDVNLLSGAYNKVVAFENNGNVYEWAKNRWAYYPEQDIDTRSSATYPRLSKEYNTNNYTASSFWIKDGSFLKIRNIELGYNFPKGLLSVLKLGSARIYINGINLFTISSLLSEYNIDPETMSGYPGIKSYNAGLTIGF
ncbi:MAG: SusC/RagA family TonB-linked outer membrane protein, partial [Candidatus Symbiothrix sp.]|nr:SusC/RagA family TonB-linked outer membrane protein [Candidatus Symbiothrix sp.]